MATPTANTDKDRGPSGTIATPTASTDKETGPIGPATAMSTANTGKEIGPIGPATAMLTANTDKETGPATAMSTASTDKETAGSSRTTAAVVQQTDANSSDNQPVNLNKRKYKEPETPRSGRCGFQFNNTSSYPDIIDFKQEMTAKFFDEYIKDKGKRKVELYFNVTKESTRHIMCCPRCSECFDEHRERESDMNYGKWKKA